MKSEEEIRARIKDMLEVYDDIVEKHEKMANFSNSHAQQMFGPTLLDLTLILMPTKLLIRYRQSHGLSIAD